MAPKGHLSTSLSPRAKITGAKILTVTWIKGVKWDTCLGPTSVCHTRTQTRTRTGSDSSASSKHTGSRRLRPLSEPPAARPHQQGTLLQGCCSSGRHLRAEVVDAVSMYLGRKQVGRPLAAWGRGVDSTCVWGGDAGRTVPVRAGGRWTPVIGPYISGCELLRAHPILCHRQPPRRPSSLSVLCGL